MLLKFCGAARKVTGSNYLVEAAGHRILVDCGMHQGDGEAANTDPFPYAASSVDAVLITHAHIDHTGRIPKLVKEGFKGKIYATLPTIELTEILWDDSVKIMREDADWQTRKNARRGLPAVEPLYGQKEADEAKKLLTPVSYDARVDLFEGISVRFRDAGHILGSSMIEMFLMEDGKVVRIVFSGDLGPMNTVMERSPAELTDADYVLIESTYGNREHKDNEATREEFQTMMKGILKEKKGKVYIPTFVVDRAQRIMYELSRLRNEGFGAEMPVYFDSPMGVKATKLYEQHLDLMSQEIQQYRRNVGNPFDSEDIQYVSTREQSQEVNEKKFGLVLAGSGMCNGGRIVHHLKNGIWDPNNHIIFVGYQAYGTPGRMIVDGAKTVRFAGETVSVRAKVHTIGGFSAHADRTDLLSWAERFRPTMPKFLVVHGESKAADSLAEALEVRGFEAYVPNLLDEIVLEPREAGQKISAAIAEAIAAPLPEQIEETMAPANPAGSAVEGKAAQTPVQSKPKGRKEKREEKRAARKANQAAVISLQEINDKLREINEKAGNGEIVESSQSLLSAVSVLLDSILQSGGKSA